MRLSCLLCNYRCSNSLKCRKLHGNLQIVLGTHRLRDVELGVFFLYVGRYDSQVSKLFMNVYVNKDAAIKYALEEKCHEGDKQFSLETC